MRTDSKSPNRSSIKNTMKLTELYSYKTTGQIWRILISDLERLIFETRDKTTKEVSYQCLELESGKKIFSELQLEEKHWLGIEVIYKDIIFFHRFPKPDMPNHKEIIAFDITSQKVLWTNNDLAFLFVHKDIVYGFKQGFDERYYTSLNYLTGEVIEELGCDSKKINMLRDQSENEKDWQVYGFPKVYVPNEDSSITKAIQAQTKGLEITGNIEFSVYYDFLFFNYHYKETSSETTNKFAAVNLETGDLLLETILNKNVRALFTDSFFVYKNYLILLYEKNEVIVYKIEKR
jgi:hypothetical protein